MKKRHVRIERGTIVLDYRSKGDRRAVQAIEDPLLLPVIKRLKRRRGGGADMLAYGDPEGGWSTVRSETINSYLKRHAGVAFSARISEPGTRRCGRRPRPGRRSLSGGGRGLAADRLSRRRVSISFDEGTAPAMTPTLDLERDEDRLIWIFGSSRSGSTWLLRMLADLPGTVPVDDPHLGHHLGVWRPIPLAWAAASEPPKLTTLLDVKREREGYFFADRYRDAWWEPLRALVRARFEAQAGDSIRDGERPNAVVVKEPGSHVAGLLCELFPASKLIFLLRDGRDVVDSWLAAHERGSWAIREGAFPVAPWGRLALVRWLSTVWVYRTDEVLRAFAAHREESRVMVRYEDLRGGTSAVLENVCATLGLGGAEPLAAVADRHAFERVPPEERGDRCEIRAARPGAWRENLSEPEQLAMHSIMASTLDRLGYLEQAPGTAAAAS